uniref:Ovule protein n=1 Tax=Romanomermis culicivorax TaxID=13658 RepID=A0A915JHW3_ROMCU
MNFRVKHIRTSSTVRCCKSSTLNWQTYQLSTNSLPQHPASSCAFFFRLISLILRIKSKHYYGIFHLSNYKMFMFLLLCMQKTVKRESP